MQKMTFENGTLVTPAKVTIDGVEHEVTPAEYSGDTPLSAENLNELQNRIETAIEIGGVSGDTLPVGAIVPFGSATPPANWLVCNGQAVSRTEYELLFNVIGTTFGAGDGNTTFNVPNLKGKIPVGQDTTQTEFDNLGETGGEKAHTLTLNEMPSHQHSGLIYANETQVNLLRGSGELTGNALQWTSGAVYPMAALKTGAEGANQAHNNLQPYTVTQYIIKARQSAGVVATVEDSLNSDSATNALSAKQGKILNQMNSGLSIAYSNALPETSGATGEIVLLEATISNAGVYLFEASIPMNYYGQDGRELLCRLKVNNVEKAVCGGIINTNAYSVYSHLTRIVEVPANANIKVTIQDTTGKTYACPAFNLQWIRLK